MHVQSREEYPVDEMKFQGLLRLKFIRLLFSRAKLKTNWKCQKLCLFDCLGIAGDDSFQPNLVLDDGGDATHVLVKKFPAVAKQVHNIPRFLPKSSNKSKPHCFENAKIFIRSCVALSRIH